MKDRGLAFDAVSHITLKHLSKVFQPLPAGCPDDRAGVVAIGHDFAAARPDCRGEAVGCVARMQDGGQSIVDVEAGRRGRAPVAGGPGVDDLPLRLATPVFFRGGEVRRGVRSGARYGLAS